MSGEKYPLDLLGEYPGTIGKFGRYTDTELSFSFFDIFTHYIKQKFESLLYPEPCQKQDVPVLCRGGRISDTAQDMHLDQPPSYRLIEGSASRRGDERSLVESASTKDDEQRPVEDSAFGKGNERGLVEGFALRKDDEHRPVENSAFRKDDERAASPHIQVTAPPKKLRHWWRSLFGSQPKKPHGHPQPTAPFLESHNPAQPTTSFLEPHELPQPTASFPVPPRYCPMVPEAQGPRRIYDMERTDRPRQESPIFKLPKSVLVKIMMGLTPLSLWSLRQASALFLTLFDDRRFYPFHDKVGLHDAHIKFSTSIMSGEQRREARAMLQPTQVVKDWCTACTQVRYRGEFEPAVIRLRELRFCVACGERHASIFFPQESIERGDENLVCIGRLGKWELCSHTEPIMWDSLKDFLPIPNIEKYGGCPHPVHQPKSGEASTKYSSFPRLHIIRWLPPNDSHTTIKIGWDLPLLDIDSKDPPSTAGIRSTLQQLIVGGALRNHKTCPHMADGKALSDFISAAVCDCFRKPRASKIPDIGLIKGTPCECSHSRNDWSRSQYEISRFRKQFLTCEDCGALYTWALTSGRITLIYRYSWSVYKPTSPAWLNLLDDLPTLAGIYHERNKHIFWCDSPGCATGRDLRLWQDMVKEEMGLHHARYEEPDIEFSDWSIHLKLSRKLEWRLGGIRLSPRVTESDKLPIFLNHVKQAAKTEFE